MQAVLESSTDAALESAVDDPRVLKGNASPRQPEKTVRISETVGIEESDRNLSQVSVNSAKNRSRSPLICCRKPQESSTDIVQFPRESAVDPPSQQPEPDEGPPETEVEETAGGEGETLDSKPPVYEVSTESEVTEPAEPNLQHEKDEILKVPEPAEPHIAPIDQGKNASLVASESPDADRAWMGRNPRKSGHRPHLAGVGALPTETIADKDKLPSLPTKKVRQRRPTPKPLTSPLQLLPIHQSPSDEPGSNSSDQSRDTISSPPKFKTRKSKRSSAHVKFSAKSEIIRNTAPRIHWDSHNACSTSASKYMYLEATPPETCVDVRRLRDMSLVQQILSASPRPKRVPRTHFGLGLANESPPKNISTTQPLPSIATGGGPHTSEPGEASLENIQADSIPKHVDNQLKEDEENVSDDISPEETASFEHTEPESPESLNEEPLENEEEATEDYYPEDTDEEEESSPEQKEEDLREQQNLQQETEEELEQEEKQDEQGEGKLGEERDHLQEPTENKEDETTPAEEASPEQPQEEGTKPKQRKASRTTLILSNLVRARVGDLTFIDLDPEIMAAPHPFTQRLRKKIDKKELTGQVRKRHLAKRTQNLDIVFTRAMNPPFNTYVDPEQNRVFLSMFGHLPTY